MGTEEFWIPAVLAAAGTGASYVNQSQANKRQDTAQTQAILDQQKIQQEASGRAKQATDVIAHDSPATIQANSTGAYVAALRKNAAGSTLGGSTSNGPTAFGASTSSLAPTAGASARFKSDLGNSQAQVESYGNTNANELGTLDAAVRQRQGEGEIMSDLATGLNNLGAQSYTKNFVDQLRASAAGTPNPWVGLGASLLTNAGKTYSKYGGSTSKVPSYTPSTDEALAEGPYGT